jgi:hypothetical protein
MAASRAVAIADLLLAPSFAQETISFSTQDGGRICADLHAPKPRRKSARSRQANPVRTANVDGRHGKDPNTDLESRRRRKRGALPQASSRLTNRLPKSCSASGRRRRYRHRSDVAERIAGTAMMRAIRDRDGSAEPI